MLNEIMDFINATNPYYLMIAIGTFIITLLASIKHESLSPVVYGGTIASIMIVYSNVLESIFLGYWVFGYTIIGVLSLAFLITWGISHIQIMYNAIDTGDLIQ